MDIEISVSFWKDDYAEEPLTFRKVKQKDFELHLKELYSILTDVGYAIEGGFNESRNISNAR